MRPGPRSIRSKLISVYVGLLTLIFVCFSAYIYWGFHAYMVRSLDQFLDRHSLQISSNILSKLPTRGPGFVASEIEARYAPELNERYMRITDAQGAVIYASANALELPPVAPIAGSKAVYRDEKLGQARVRIVERAYQLPDGRHYLIEVGGPEAPIFHALHGLMEMLAFGFLILIGLAVAAGYALLGWTLRPVDRIVRAAEGITYKNLGERLPVPATGDEFERISEALNRMIGRLEESFRIATRFSGDASHELRTPLTVIRGELEALLKGAVLLPEVRQRVGEILVEMERLTHIVEGLLLVSRLESGEGRQKPVTLDLAELTGHVADQMEPLAEDKGVALQRQLEPGVQVEGDEVRLKQVMVNLLDNAIKYTPTGGRVLLRLVQQAGQAQLEVADTGRGIRAEARAHVFERFYRAEDVRSDQIEGTGLGLAIVQSIVEAHQGSVTVTSGAEGGSVFTVRLPSLIPS